jgi:chromosome partitioning protein
MQTIAVLNFKGGVGKTTFTACVAQALALAGHRVLAIDNDYQCNLTAMLGQRPAKPGIREVYLASVGIGGRNLSLGIKKTDIANLDVLPSSPELRNEDVKDTEQLKKAMIFDKVESRYDYVIIDDSPGLDRLQQAALHAANKVFVPTELSHFAISGIYEMHREMVEKFGSDARITGIIPAFYRGTKQDRSYIEALHKLFPGRICPVSIPYDSVFDGLTEQRKVLFLHRLSSKAADSYIAVVNELFGLDIGNIRFSIEKKRDQRMREEACGNLEKAREVTKTARLKL